MISPSLSTVDQRINSSNLYESDTSLSDYQFEDDDIMEESLEMTQEGVYLKNGVKASSGGMFSQTRRSTR
jgi:hypothetical protein